MFETIEFYYDKHFCIKYFSSIIHVYIYVPQLIWNRIVINFILCSSRVDLISKLLFFYCSFPVTRRGTDNADAVGP